MENFIQETHVFRLKRDMITLEFMMEEVNIQKFLKLLVAFTIKPKFWFQAIKYSLALKPKLCLTMKRKVLWL